MTRRTRQVNIGIVGCGAIGSRIALATRKELKGLCRVSGIFDIDAEKIRKLEKLLRRKAGRNSLRDLLRGCDLMVEAVNAQSTRHIIKQALQAKRSVLAMSAGKLLHSRDLFSLAHKNDCSLLIPSGAIAGIDAVKAASLAGINQIVLTTRKPPAGLANAPFIRERGINLSRLKGETLIFEGPVDEAVKYFPQNINVAATLALAGQIGTNKLLIRIITSPHFTQNSHEIELTGAFGRMFSRTENMVCPDNPKSSYLAVLSGIQTIKEFCTRQRIGT